MKCVICGREFKGRRAWGGEISPCCGRSVCMAEYRARQTGDARFDRQFQVVLKCVDEDVLRKLSVRQILERVKTGTVSVLRAQMEFARRKRSAAQTPEAPNGESDTGKDGATPPEPGIEKEFDHAGDGHENHKPEAIQAEDGKKQEEQCVSQPQTDAGRNLASGVVNPMQRKRGEGNSRDEGRE